MISAVFITTLSAISILLIILLKIEKNKVKWFEAWGREYIEKHRDEAKRDGFTK